MRFGVALPAAGTVAAAGMGFDFVELRVSDLDPEDVSQTWPVTANAIESAGIPAATYNFFLPSDLAVVGPHVDQARLRRYVARAAERATAIGGETFVFGSGRARWVPPGFDSQMALAQFRAAAEIAAEEATRQGMTIALEALNRTEANLVTLLSDSVQLAAQIDLPNVGVVADSYHMLMMGEPFSVVLDAGSRLRHVQVCDSGRLPPGSGVGDLAGFFIYLNALGYDGSVAIEIGLFQLRNRGTRRARGRPPRRCAARRAFVRPVIGGET